MRSIDLKDVEYEVAQTKKALLEYFELVIIDSSAWARSRKKILDAFGDDGLAHRLRSLFNSSTTERKGSNVI